MRSESSFAYLGAKKNFSVGTVGYNAVFGLKVQWRSGILDAKAVLAVEALRIRRLRGQLYPLTRRGIRCTVLITKVRIRASYWLILIDIVAPESTG